MTPDIPDHPSHSSSTNHPATADLHPASDQALLATLETSSHTFLQPPPSLHVASLVLAKRYLDPLAASTSDAQIQRQLNRRRKRKRGEVDDYDSVKPLRLREIHLEGFRIDQVWEQARRVLDATRLEIERSLSATQLRQEKTATPVNTVKHHAPNGKLVRFRNSEDEADDPEAEETEVNEDGFAVEDDLSEGSEGPVVIDAERIDSQDEDEEMLDEDDLAEVLDEDDMEASDIDEGSKETFIPDKLGLNDGFFSIDDFNRQSEFLEQQDARGENDGARADEEDIDWDADPLATSSSRKAGQSREDEAVGESEDEEDGPTFGNADIDGPNISDSDDASEKGVEMEDIGALNNTNDIKYADFFEPPPRKATKSRRRALPKTQPPPSASTPIQKTEDDLQRTISAVRRDIFEDDLTPSEDEAASDINDPRSSHQKRQAALTAEIRRLEAAAVAKRDWTLSGEARATDRPVNSLLEEDLEFERAGKPIPVITQEVSEDIEALIKRRIIAREFDEVIRRRPGNLATGAADVGRGRFELDDTKAQQSLAEMYEADHLKTVNPEGYTDKRDEKLKREHAKIEAMWKDVSAKLDALSSWHYKPKPPSASLNIVADVPTISMEDARPAAGGDVGGESMLAPQEIYKAGEGRDKKSEVGTRSGLPVGREEMTRDEKVRRRRREKERIRKAGGVVPGKKEGKGGRLVGKKEKERQGVIGDLKKGGVRVIGKKGEIRDVEGKTVRGQGAVVGKGGGGYKL